MKRFLRAHRTSLLLTVCMLLAMLIGPGFALGAGVFTMGAIVDAQQMFSNAQSMAASAASTNIVDLGEERRIGTGEPMALVYTVTTALDGANADETYSAQLQSDSTDAFGSPASVGGAVALTRGSAAGTKFILVIPPGTATERFLRVNYTIGGTTPSGNVTAELKPLSMVDTSGASVFYADAITISI